MRRGVAIFLIIIAIIAAFLAGLNFQSVEFRETIRYVQGETIRDSIIVPAPYRVEIPKIVHLPMRPDTVFLENEIVIVERVDTAQIIREFISIHHYAFNVFDIETVGRLDVRQSIQYNRLRSFDYEFTPIQREITRIIRPFLTPYISVSANTFSTLGIGGGVFVRNIGIEYQFLHNTQMNSSGHQILLKYRFR